METIYLVTAIVAVMGFLVLLYIFRDVRKALEITVEGIELIEAQVDSDGNPYRPLSKIIKGIVAALAKQGGVQDVLHPVVKKIEERVKGKAGSRHEI